MSRQLAILALAIPMLSCTVGWAQVDSYPNAIVLMESITSKASADAITDEDIELMDQVVQFVLARVSLYSAPAKSEVPAYQWRRVRYKRGLLGRWHCRWECVKVDPPREAPKYRVAASEFAERANALSDALEDLQSVKNRRDLALQIYGLTLTADNYSRPAENSSEPGNIQRDTTD